LRLGHKLRTPATCYNYYFSNLCLSVVAPVYDSVGQALATSRAFGDAELKFPLQRRLVVSTPDVRVVELGRDDVFLILACDGVWDVRT
jgi:serine/threonine protein phosphatase PrpC